MRTAICIFLAFVAGFLVRNWIGRLTFYHARVVRKDDDNKKMKTMPEDAHPPQEYVKNLEALVTARTEQLRMALQLVHELAEAIKPFRPDLAQKAIESMKNGLTPGA